MLIDAPGMEETDGKGDTEIELNEDNANEVLNIINSLNR